jgi:hypothetical protein
MHAIIKQVAAMNLLGVAALIHSHDAARVAVRHLFDHG